jgi:hypothetical protein
LVFVAVVGIYEDCHASIYGYVVVLDNQAVNPAGLVE